MPPDADPAEDVTSAWAWEVVTRTMLALEPERVPGAGTSADPRLGIPARRRARLLAAAFEGLPAPGPADLAAATGMLRRLHGREYRLAADDLVAAFPVTTVVSDPQGRDPRTPVVGGPGRPAVDGREDSTRTPGRGPGTDEGGAP